MLDFKCLPSPASIYNHLLLKNFKPKIIRNLHNSELPKLGHALVYYKTDPLVPGFLNNYQHTNLWEIKEIVRIFNSFGIWVDLLDRSVNCQAKLPDKYNFFIANASGNSGACYPHIAQQLTRAIKIFYATTASPDVHNQRILDRTPDSSRLADQVDLATSMNITDYIFSICGENANQTYQRFNKPVYQINSSTAPFLRPPTNRNFKRKNWLFLAGHGNYLKGLDLVLDTFSNLPQHTIYICTHIESPFLKKYQRLIRASSNIKLIGPIHLNSQKFHKISKDSLFSILPSATEGLATSITSTLRLGLIPVITPEVGLPKKIDFGFTIPKATLTNVRHAVQDANHTPINELQVMSQRAFVFSHNYTQSRFTQTFTHALTSVASHSTSFAQSATHSQESQIFEA